MPELPEVETVARQLEPVLCHRLVHRVEIVDPKLHHPRVQEAHGRRFGRVFRQGKQVLMELVGGGGGRGPLWLAVHLRMSGRLLWAEKEPVTGPRHLRARFFLDQGALLFVDPRRFGQFTWLDDPGQAAPPGTEPLAPEFTAAKLADLLAGSRQSLKTWLLRQDRITGLGNIYASEVLYRARLSPFRAAGSLRPAEVHGLHRAIRQILGKAIRCCGTTFSDFQGAHGLTGSFQRYLRVYEREGRPCFRCRTPIRRVTQSQRSTYYCPQCLKSTRKKGGPGQETPRRRGSSPGV